MLPMRPASAGPSGSAMSTTSGLRRARLSASATTGANSVSTSTTRAAPWSIMKAMVAASRRTFMALSTAPAIGTPNAHS